MREWDMSSSQREGRLATTQLEINETEGEGKAKYGESTAAKKGSIWREQEGRKYPFQDTFLVMDRWHNSLEPQTLLSPGSGVYSQIPFVYLIPLG